MPTTKTPPPSPVPANAAPAEPPGLLRQSLAGALAWNWEKTLYLLLIVAAFATRFYDLGARVMSHDESLHTQYSWYLFKNGNYVHSPMMHGPLKFEATAFTYWLLGDNDFTSRIPTALMGVVTVGLIYFFRKWLGRTGALVAALMALISPYLLYYARYIRDEPYVMVWGMLTALCVLNYMETRSAKYLYGLAAVSALFYATMETSFIYFAITLLFLGAHWLRELFAAEWPQPAYRPWFIVAGAIAIVAVGVTVAAVAYNQQAVALSGAETAAPANPNSPTAAATPWASPALQTLAMFCSVLAVAGVGAAVAMLLLAFGDALRRFAALDLMVIFGVFVLPQLGALAVQVLGLVLRRTIDPLAYTPPSVQGIPFPDSLFIFLGSDTGVTFITVCLLLAVSLAVGLLWNWRRFLICAGLFYSIYIPAFTTFFTNGGGLATGLVGSLGYWLVQQGVQRGGQPLYYYLLVQLPLYEFLPTLGVLLAAGLALARWLRPETARLAKKAARAEGDAEPLVAFPPLAYLGFWAFMAPIAFSIAGERMPWLTTHITLPFILLSGWAIGWVIDGVDWRRFARPKTWLLAGLTLVCLLAVGAALGSLLGAHPPFQGNTLEQSQATLAFLGAVLVAAGAGAGVYWLSDEAGGRQVTRLAGLWLFAILALFTARTAFTAAYINYDAANEFMVYAHGARGVKTVIQQIEDISVRTHDGLGLRVVYDAPVAWPMTWYFRNFTNQGYIDPKPTRDLIGDAAVVVAGSQNWADTEKLLGSRYYSYEYIRMVWPMQDYFGLATWRNVLEGLPLAPNRCRTQATYASAEALLQDQVRIAQDCKAVLGGLWTNKDYRQALWNIWARRDYTLYGQLTGQNFDLSQWPVVDRMRMYVRKDIAAQIWSYGVNAAAAPAAPTAVPYEAQKQVLTADPVWGTLGADQGQFNAPRSVAVAADGSVYVADSRNHRIQKFDASGKFLLSWGTFGTAANGQAAPPGTFNEPWGVAVAPDGSVYVADTWNHRIQKFDANGQFVLSWGHEGQAEQYDAFWGPRAVAVDGAGRVFVADTGNKRIAVFDDKGNGLTSIGVPGQAGADAGFLNEPVGVTVSADGLVYVADTWNQRVQVFKPDATGTYAPVTEWPVEAWYGQSLENKPYLAVDKQGRVYATDPENPRVLVFDQTGKFLLTWGESGASNAQFTTVSGIAVSAAGSVYVADAGNNRVMRFPPVP